MDRLPSLNYSLYSEPKLRRKLGELGISSAGPKHHLIKRHMEWVDLVNANCDSASPKSKRELLRNLEEWEKAQGGSAMGSLTQKKWAAVMEKNFDRASWSSAHGNDFQRLIEQARGQRNGQKPSEARPEEAGDTATNSPAPDCGLLETVPGGGQTAPAKHTGPDITAQDRVVIDLEGSQESHPQKEELNHPQVGLR